MDKEKLEKWKFNIGDLVTHTILQYMIGVVTVLDPSGIGVKWFTESKNVKNIKDIWNKTKFSPVYLEKIPLKENKNE